MKNKRDIEEKLKDLNKVINNVGNPEYVAGWINALNWVLEGICK